MQETKSSEEAQIVVIGKVLNISNLIENSVSSSSKSTLKNKSSTDFLSAAFNSIFSMTRNDEVQSVRSGATKYSVFKITKPVLSCHSAGAVCKKMLYIFHTFDNWIFKGSLCERIFNGFNTAFEYGEVLRIITVFPKRKRAGNDNQIAVNHKGYPMECLAFRLCMGTDISDEELKKKTRYLLFCV